MLAYSQVDVNTGMFMEPPKGFRVEGAHSIEWTIILDKNLYVLKDAVLAWFDKLKEDLEARYFY